MMKILFITNIPTPYRVDFFNELGRACELTVVFEAKSAPGVRFDFGSRSFTHFEAVFLSQGDINERRVNPAIFRFLRRGRYDHIFATSYGYFTEMAALLYMGIWRIPYWLELDGGVIRQGESFWRRRLKSSVIRGARGIFSSGGATDRAMLHYGASPQRLHRYPFTSLHQRDLLSLPPSRQEKDALKARLGINQARVVVAVGQFIHRKGMDTLLRAAAGIPGDVGFYLIGGKPTEEYIALAAGDERIHFLAFMEMERLREYYRAADVMALPTREDVWGLVVNEAMACGLPVITTVDCVAGVELIRDGMNGRLIKKDDPGAVCTAVQTLLADEAARQAMAQAALATVSDYTVEQMAAAHWKVLKREAGEG